MDKLLEFTPITKVEHLCNNNFNYLIVLLASISPESTW